MTKQSRFLFSIPYFIWLLLFVVTPLGMIFYKSFFDINGQVRLETTRTISRQETT